MAELRLRVGADVAPALDGLRQLETRMRSTTAAGQTFGKGIDVATKGLQKLPQTSSAATQSLVNLSRVAQDAPFGFIGIANNINPLLESFQRLKVSTGSTGGAFKALAGSLTGPAGLGLAVGVVSSLLVVFGDKLFSSGKAAKEAKEQNDKLAESVAGEVVKLTSLVAIVQNVNASQEDRRKALAAINQEYGKYLPSIDKENVTLANIAESYDKITNSLLRQAVVKGLQEEIEKAVTKTASQLIGLEKTEALRRQKFEQDTKRTQDQLRATNSLENQLGRYNQTVKDGTLALQGQRSEQIKSVGVLNGYEATLKRLKDQLKRDLEPLFGILGQFSFDDLNIKLPAPKTTSVKDDDVVPLLGLGGDSTEALFNTINRIFGRIQDRVNFNIKNIPKKAKADSGVFQKLDTFSFRGFKGLTEAQLSLAKTAETISGLLTPAFNNLIDAISRGENAFKAFGEGVKQALVGVISKLLETAILAATLSILFPGGLGGAKGFGAIFGQLLGFGGARASGGPVGSGKSYLVGENGPELFTPSVSGRIIPNGQIGGVSLGGRSAGGGSVVLRGRELRLLGVRTTNSQLRLGVRA